MGSRPGNCQGWQPIAFQVRGSLGEGGVDGSGAGPLWSPGPVAQWVSAQNARKLFCKVPQNVPIFLGGPLPWSRTGLGGRLGGAPPSGALKSSLVIGQYHVTVSQGGRWVRAQVILSYGGGLSKASARERTDVAGRPPLPAGRFATPTGLPPNSSGSGLAHRRSWW